MLNTIVLLCAAVVASSEEDPWAKVRELNTGSEVRIYKTGVKRPVTAQFQSLGQEAVIVIQKNAQVSILKSRIERIDARPAPSGNRAAMEAGKTVGTKEESITGRSKDSTLPPRSTYGSVKIRSKPEFTTVYKRN